MALNSMAPLSEETPNPQSCRCLWSTGSIVATVSFFALFFLFVLDGGGLGIFGQCGYFTNCAPEFLAELQTVDGGLAKTGSAASPQPGVELNNIAEDRPAEQSSTGQSLLGLASHATDGNTDGDFLNGSCTHTADVTPGTPGSTEPWWRVDLGQTAPIAAVEVWNREDCCMGRLEGAEVWVSYTSASFSAGTKCSGAANGSENPGRPFVYSCRNLTGQYVWVRLPRKEGVLSLCEVRVLSTSALTPTSPPPPPRQRELTPTSPPPPPPQQEWTPTSPPPPPPQSMPYDPCFDHSVMTRKVDFSDRETKYLFYGKSGDFCAGSRHKSWSYTCAFGEAAYLNRTFVLDFDWCLHAVHTGLTSNVVKDARLYFDVAGFRSRNVVPLSSFMCYLAQWEREHKESISTRHIWHGTKGPSTPELANDNSTLIHRHFASEGEYYYEVCARKENSRIRRQYILWLNPELSRIKYAIQAAMGWNYDAVHVRRGDKARDKRRWPHVDNDTRPENMLMKLPKFIPHGRTLYIATDETEPHFFDVLASKYNIFTLQQFTYLWAPGSRWYKAAETLQRQKRRNDYVDFDNYMRAEIDYNLLEDAKKKVETFNDLTADDRHGVLK